MITRNTFEALATALRRQVDNANTCPNTKLLNALQDIADEASMHFAQSNPRFDRARFMNACGLED